MFVGFNSGSVVTVLSKRPLTALALVVFLRGAPGDELHALGDDVASGVFDQQVDVVGCDYVIEDAETKTFLCLEHPMQVAASVALPSVPETWKFRIELLVP